MAAEDETVEQPSTAEKLARFMLDKWDADDFTHGNGAEDAALAVMQRLAEKILSDFLQVDVEANIIFARPGVDADTMQPYALVHWGPMIGRLTADELRDIGGAFMQVAETSEVESLFVQWLASDENADRENVARILRSFRIWRASLAVETVD